MRLIGSKEFLLSVKPGTLFYDFETTRDYCMTIIEEYLNGVDIVEKYPNLADLHIFGDNSGSIAFYGCDELVKIDGLPYDCIFYYDKNIVGDASPTQTLYLVLDSEDEWPEHVDVKESRIVEALNKDDLKRIVNNFVSENSNAFTDETSSWVIQTLMEDTHYKDDGIVNYGMTAKSLGKYHKPVVVDTREPKSSEESSKDFLASISYNELMVQIAKEILSKCEKEK